MKALIKPVLTIVFNIVINLIACCGCEVMRVVTYYFFQRGKKVEEKNACPDVLLSCVCACACACVCVRVHFFFHRRPERHPANQPVIRPSNHLTIAIQCNCLRRFNHVLKKWKPKRIVTSRSPPSPSQKK